MSPFPSAWTVSARWSSVNRKSTLGRAPRPAGSWFGSAPASWVSTRLAPSHSAASRNGARFRNTRCRSQVEGAGTSAEHGVESHVLAHLGTLLLVVHEQLAILVVLPLLAPLGRKHETAHGGRCQLAAILVALAEANG